jgi:hypothetical protein
VVPDKAGSVARSVKTASFDRTNVPN